MWLNAAQTPNIVVLKIQYQSLYNLVFHVFHVHPCIQKRTRLMDAVGHCIDEHRSCQSTLITARVWWTNKRRKVIRQDIRWCGRWWKIFYILHLKFQVVYRQRSGILFTIWLCACYFFCQQWIAHVSCYCFGQFHSPSRQNWCVGGSIILNNISLRTYFIINEQK